MKLISFFVLMSVVGLTTNVFASAQDYPELMVVPKASERLSIEAAKENINTWSNYAPLHIAGATTLVAGITGLSDLDKDKDEKGLYPKIAIAVGAGWLATSLWMQNAYHPYHRALREINALNKQSAKSQLANERLAEEYISQASVLAKKIKWASFITNAGASALTIRSAKKDTLAQGTAVLGVVTSFLPLLFPLNWERVNDDHQSYKKKIFGSVTFTNGLLINPENQKPTLGLIMASTF